MILKYLHVYRRQDGLGYSIVATQFENAPYLENVPFLQLNKALEFYERLSQNENEAAIYKTYREAVRVARKLINPLGEYAIFGWIKGFEGEKHLIREG